ncbi:MAG: glycosyltransferase family 87 protein [Actinomycetota bacterium]
MSSVLVAGMILIFFAEKRGWAPPLIISVLVAIAARAIVVAMIQNHRPQPTDFADQFPLAGLFVLQHGDPTSFHHGTNNLIPFLPLLPYLFAAELWICLHTGAPWAIIGRIVPVVADISVVYLVSRLAPTNGERRAFQYALNPISILVCALHGQMDPILLPFVVGAFIAARRQKPILAGFLVGIAAAGRSWPVIFIPGVAITLKGGAKRLKAIGASIVPTLLVLASMPIMVSTSYSELYHRVLGYRPAPGEWGWAGVALAVLREAANPHIDSWQSLGSKMAIAGVFLAIFLWRRGSGEDMSIAAICAFFAFTVGFGIQYLVWPVALFVARPTKYSRLALFLASIYVMNSYLILTHMPNPFYTRAHGAAMGLSIAIIVVLIAAMPWERRKQGPELDLPAISAPAQSIAAEELV